MGTICVPFSNTLYDVLEDYLHNASAVTNYINSSADALVSTRLYILLSVFIGLVITIVYLIFLQCCVGVVVWLSVLLVFVLLLAAGIIACQNDLVPIGVALLTAAGLYAIVFVCCSYQRLKVAIAVYKASSRMLSSNLRLALIPFAIMALSLIFFFWWALSGALFLSRNLVAKKGDFFAGVDDLRSNEMLYFYYYVFCGLWVAEWIKSLGAFVVLAFSAQWYYAQNDPSGPVMESALGTSWKWGLWTHSGSLAFGSFFVAVIEMLRLLLEYAIKQAKDKGADGNKAAEAAACCARCCLGCLQKLVECLNRTAYTIIALSGDKYCVAAGRGLKLALSNPFHAVILAGVGQAIQFLGNLIISLSNTLIFYYMSGLASDDFTQGALPLLLVFLMSYILASTFMGLEATSADAMITCFFIDNELENAHDDNQKLRAPEEFKQLYEDY